MTFYFAYGSNMNPRRMVQRGMEFTDALPGKLRNMGLRFNKRSRHNPTWACANVIFAPGEEVEGVLYRLQDDRQIFKMDPFEGAPRYYSREAFPVVTDQGEVFSWVYVANPANIDNQLLPLRWYLGQLLEGKPYLSGGYYQWLSQTPCHEDDHDGWG
jgi:Gamma-glutamyl cyclotransferase, AIG2-like